MRQFLIITSIVLLAGLSACKTKPQPVFNYRPVFDQTKKEYVRIPSNKGVQLDTIVLIRSNLRDEVVIVTDTVDLVVEYEFCHAELLVPVELINIKPPTYDTILVAKEYLYQSKYINDIFPFVPEKVKMKYGLKDSLPQGAINFAAETFDTSTTYNPTSVYDDGTIKRLIQQLPAYLTKEEILSDETRDLYQADSLLSSILEESPWRIGDSIPIYNNEKSLYYDNILMLKFDTIKIVVFDSTKIIPQLPREKLRKVVCEKVLVKERYITFDSVTFKVFYPDEKDIYIDMVRVEGGDFKIGNNEFDDDERPATQITVSSFLLSKYELTNDLFCYFLNDIKCDSLGKTDGLKIINLENQNTKIVRNKHTGKFTSMPGFENHPVVNVTWQGASMFCIRASGRLPSEAEWEYAAKGGKYAIKYYTDLKKSDYEYEFRFAGGNFMPELGYFVDNSGGECHSVGKLRPNALGLFDMCGNVWEWCYDKYSNEYYSRGIRSRDPMNLEGPNIRSNRGGSWSNDAQYCRICNRNFLREQECNPYLGFRYMRPWK